MFGHSLLLSSEYPRCSHSSILPRIMKVFLRVSSWQTLLNETGWSSLISMDLNPHIHGPMHAISSQVIFLAADEESDLNLSYA